MPLIDRKPTDQRRRDKRVSGKSSRNVGRQFRQQNARCGKRVVAYDLAVGRKEQERGRNILPRILSRLHAKVSVERLDTAREGTSVMPRAERLDAEARPLLPCHAPRRRSRRG